VCECGGAPERLSCRGSVLVCAVRPVLCAHARAVQVLPVSVAWLILVCNLDNAGARQGGGAGIDTAQAYVRPLIAVLFVGVWLSVNTLADEEDLPSCIFFVESHGRQAYRKRARQQGR
jgi:hypothetical protein